MSYALVNRPLGSAEAFISGACSEEAEQTQVWFRAIIDHLHRSDSIGMDRAFSDLFDVARETRESGWDGYEALPVSLCAYRLAAAFLRSIPFGVPVPTIGAEPDGHIAIEWYRSPRRTLSVSVAPDGQLHYSALLGQATAYGTETFVGAVPDRILRLIEKVRPS